MAHDISAVDRAIGFVREALGGARKEGRNRLPPVRSMARGAGVSLVTMWKAVQRLKESGDLFAAPGVGLLLSPRVVAPPRPAEAPGPERHVWVQTSRRLERDILNRVYPPDSMLPSAKQLQTTYAVSYLTLRKALDDLRARGALEPRHRGFAVPAIRAQRARSRVALCAARRFPRDIGSNELSLGILGQEHLRQLETECSKAGLRIDTFYYYQDGQRVVFCSSDDDRPVSVMDDEDTLGFIWLITGTDAVLGIDVDQVAGKLAEYRKPVAVFSEVAEAVPLAKIRRAPHLRIFLVAVDEKPAVTAARYLLHQGHASIAYISAFHRFSWSHARLAGLESVFAAAGKKGKVHALTLDDIATGLFALDAQRGEPAPLSASIEAWLGQAPVRLTSQARASLDTPLRMALREDEIERRLQPLFGRALERKEITAWVAANDAVAVMALRFLRGRRIRIPRDLSLLSFDNSADATINKITSYDFNLSACVTAMIAHILKRSVARRQIVEIDGAIVQRRTTGLAARG